MHNEEASLWFYMKDLTQSQLKGLDTAAQLRGGVYGPDPLDPNLLLSGGLVSTPIPGRL